MKMYTQPFMVGCVYFPNLFTIAIIFGNSFNIRTVFFKNRVYAV